jgi:adenine-specific DNA methylase
MKFCFTSSLGQASKLVFVYRKPGRERQVGGWATRGYWIPPEYFEINAWNCFAERFSKLLRGKAETNKLLGNALNEASNFSELGDNRPLLLLNQSSTDLPNIPGDSVDYMFTDPPYGDAVPYLELDLMWASWLKMPMKFEDEIIISDSPARKKDFDEYFRMLTQAFREVHRVLKPEHWLTVTFHSTDIRVYNSIIRAVVFAGFNWTKSCTRTRREHRRKPCWLRTEVR